MSAIIPENFKVPALTQLDRQLSILEEGSKDHASAALVAFLQGLRSFVSGMNRIIPCSATGTNVITLQPTSTAPLITKYVDYEVYAFTAQNTSTGLVTMTVVPANGSLATLKAFKTNGAAQATTGDIVANSVYLAIFADHLDTGVGGFVIK